jgi:transcriptional regulator with XRE-family HTH domain
VTSRRHQPPAPPPGFWDRSEIIEALAARDMGAFVRNFRKWTGASQTDISMMVGIPQPHVSELERGLRHVTALNLFERFADGLGIPRRLLGLADHSSDEGPLPKGMDEHVASSQREWLRTRRMLNQHRPELTQLAAQLYPSSIRLADTGILMPEEWRLDRPVDLSSIDLTLRDAPPPPVTGRHEETRSLRPLVAPGRHYDKYHRAMRDLDRPRLFENRVCYRLLGVEWPSFTVQAGLTVGHMRYFDMIDVGEALAHEVALASIDRDGNIKEDRCSWNRLPFRRLVRDPFDLQAYPLMLSISTLTIRRSRAGATFILLRRGAGQVAIAGGMLSVMPTGVFQPASILPAPDSPDFDLWRNMMREYSEEFLGNPEHDGSGDPIDYASQEPFRSLDAARRTGKIRVSCLGAGIDALNFVGDLFTVAVFDADVFDEVFDELVELNEEGTVTSGWDRQQFIFDGPTIHDLLATEPMAPSGAACLYLAWQHRTLLLS